MTEQQLPSRSCPQQPQPVSTQATMENPTPDLNITISDADGTALVEFNRPKKRNAFSQAMITQLVDTLGSLDANPAVRAIVVTGSPGGPFCAGMDLKELVQISTAEAHRIAFLKDLTGAFAQCRKPTIAAVVGFALGGGCEIAMACDMIIAADDSSFGLPEIKIGTIPGAGGTQRIARALGKHRAMEFVLTGRSASGSEFERLGLVNRVFPKEEVVPEALKLAARIASLSGPVVQTGKQAVLTAENSHLPGGMDMEKALYYSTFDLGDCKEGISAFLEKRAPVFKHE